MQVLRIKNMYRRSVNPLANDYPALWRLCNTRRILNAIQTENLPVAKVDFYYLLNLQWGSYFPSN